MEYGYIRQLEQYGMYLQYTINISNVHENDCWLTINKTYNKNINFY